jgi:1,4-dihydroxy-2-naphthoate octaprenyltransferase
MQNVSSKAATRGSAQGGLIERIKLFALGARPKTLTAAVIPVMVGSAYSHLVLTQGDTAQGGLPSAVGQWWLIPVILLSAISIQVGTNYFNDALDFERGADTPGRIGPRRITASGACSASEVKRAGLVAFGIALLTGFVLVMYGGWLILCVGLASLLCGYAYTGGPYPLAYNGWGDLFVLLFFGVIAVAGTVFLLVGAVPAQALLAGLQIGLPAVALIAINNARDIEGDARAGKRTLAVRLGRVWAHREIRLALVLPLALGIGWWPLICAALLPLLALPLVIGAITHLGRIPVATISEDEGELAIDRGAEYNRLLAYVAAVHAAYGILLCIGLWIDAALHVAV